MYSVYFALSWINNKSDKFYIILLDLECKQTSIDYWCYDFQIIHNDADLKVTHTLRIILRLTYVYINNFV